MLARKHEKEGDKKACNRSWENVYAMLRGASMSCYKDLEHAKADPNTHIHRESAINLHGASCEVAKDYGKRPYVFRLKLSDGSEYLFQAKDADEQENWIERINSVTGAEGAGIPTGFQQAPDSDKTKQGASSH